MEKEQFRILELLCNIGNYKETNIEQGFTTETYVYQTKDFDLVVLYCLASFDIANASVIKEFTKI